MISLNNFELRNDIINSGNINSINITKNKNKSIIIKTL